MSSGPEFEIRVADWLSVADAQRRVLGHARALPGEWVPLSEALGRALAEDVSATATLPPWDNAAMDGYAVRGEDIERASAVSPVTLRVSGIIRAGGTPCLTVEPGQAVRIMTGAPVPQGADTVVRVEDTDAEAVSGLVRILRDRDVGRHVRPGGQDMKPGDTVLFRGESVHPGTVAVLAALGHERAFVHRAPRVALVTTGDELRGTDRYNDVREGAGVPESNGPMLAAAVVATGGVPLPSGIVPDDDAALRDAVAAAADADVLVTVGGASMGEADLVKRVLDGEGFEQDFWRVNMRPGSPFSFGRLPRGDSRQPVFGLPGNPASAFVTFEIFVRPFLRTLAGHRAVHRLRLRGKAAQDFQGGKRTLFVRVTLDSTVSPPRVHGAGPQGSGLVRSLAAAQGLAVIPVMAALAPGDDVEVILLDSAASSASTSPLEGLAT
jgi:molybdopterin molybdotransferase